jgi:hypothetical protein
MLKHSTKVWGTYTHDKIKKLVTLISDFAMTVIIYLNTITPAEDETDFPKCLISGRIVLVNYRSEMFV